MSISGKEGITAMGADQSREIGGRNTSILRKRYSKHHRRVGGGGGGAAVPHIVPTPGPATDRKSPQGSEARKSGITPNKMLYSHHK